MDVKPSSPRDVLRVPTVFVPVPVLLIDSEDPYVQAVAEEISSKTEGYPDYLRMTAALWFVQSAVRYASDASLYGCEEFWASPSETLCYHRGDCEDTSVLLISVLGAMGFDSVLLDYDGHEAVGIPQGDSTSPDDYLYCETAVDGIMRPGSGRPEGTPGIWTADDVSSVRECANTFVALYRDLVGKVAGTLTRRN